MATLAVVLLAACGGGGGGSAVAPIPSSAPVAPAPSTPAGVTLSGIAVTPYAVWADELPNVTVTVTARATLAAGAHLALSYFDGLVGATGSQLRRTMYDDGTHGDVRALDGVWTLAFAPALQEPALLRLYDASIDAVPIMIEAIAADGSAMQPKNLIDSRLELAVVSRALAGEFPLRNLASDVAATDYMINVVAPTWDGEHFATITERAYAVLGGDPFDFIAIFHTRATGDGIPRSFAVRNDVVGINLGTYDHSAAYGSAGRLQQLVFQNVRTLGVELNHEIGHRWAAYLNEDALNLSLHTGFHWGASNHVGQMGNGPHLSPTADGNYLVTNADGSEKFVANAFSMLELYLMGMASPGEVDALRFVTDPSVDVRFGTTVAAADTRIVTIDDIIAIYGARTPAVIASQIAFTAALIVVSDAPIDEAERTLTSTIARYAAGTSAGGERAGGLFAVLDPMSFGAATQFRATLETRIP